MRTGRYRVRRGLLNAAVLQEEHDDPTYIGGHVDVSLRQITWHDVRFDRLDTIRFAPMRPDEPKVTA